MAFRLLTVLLLLGPLAHAAPSEEAGTPRMPALSSRRQQEYDALGYDPKKVFAAFIKLQRAFGKKDFDAFVKVVTFPLRITLPDGTAKSIERQDDLRVYRPLIFSAHNATVVRSQRFQSLSLRDEGVALGNGELWISGTCTDGEAQPCSYGVTLVTLAPPGRAK